MTERVDVMSLDIMRFKVGWKNFYKKMIFVRDENSYKFFKF